MPCQSEFTLENNCRIGSVTDKNCGDENPNPTIGKHSLIGPIFTFHIHLKKHVFLEFLGHEFCMIQEILKCTAPKYPAR